MNMMTYKDEHSYTSSHTQWRIYGHKLKQTDSGGIEVRRGRGCFLWSTSQVNIALSGRQWHQVGSCRDRVDPWAYHLTPWTSRRLLVMSPWPIQPTWADCLQEFAEPAPQISASKADLLAADQCNVCSLTVIGMGLQGAAGSSSRLSQTQVFRTCLCPAHTQSDWLAAPQPCLPTWWVLNCRLSCHWKGLLPNRQCSEVVCQRPRPYDLVLHKLVFICWRSLAW